MLANTSIKVVLKILFPIFSNANFQFGAKKLTWKSYIIVEALSITSQVELINKKKIAKAAIDKNPKTFVIYILAIDITK